MGTESGEKKGYLRYLEVVTGSLEEKRQWRKYRARVKKLPENYRSALEALQRYLMMLGPADGPDAMSMYEDLIDLFEQSAADGTPIREIFGDDPIEFVETFIQAYQVGRWRNREQERFTSAIDRAAGEETGSDHTDSADTGEEGRSV